MQEVTPQAGPTSFRVASAGSLDSGRFRLKPVTAFCVRKDFAFSETFPRKNTQLGTAAFLLRTVTLFLEAFKRPFKMIPQANLLIAKSDKWPCARPGSILFAVLSGCAVRDLGASSEGKSCLRLLPPSLTFAIRRTSKVLPRLGGVEEFRTPFPPPFAWLCERLHSVLSRAS